MLICLIIAIALSLHSPAGEYLFRSARLLVGKLADAFKDGKHPFAILDAEAASIVSD
jgi:hypothetical protein